MVGTQTGREGQRGVGRHVFRIVETRLEIAEILMLHGCCRRDVTSVEVADLVAMVGSITIGEVGLALQHVLDEVGSQSGGVLHGEFFQLAPRRTLIHTGVSRVDSSLGPRAVEVAQSGNGEALCLDLTLDGDDRREVGRTIGVHHGRLVIDATPQFNVVAHGQPAVESQRALGAEVEALELFVAYLIDATRAIVAAGEEIGGPIGTAGEAEVVLRGGIAVFIGLGKPVGIAEVVVIAVGIDADLLKRRIGIAALQLTVPVVPADDELIEAVVDGAGLLAFIVDIGIVEIGGPLQSIGHHFWFDGA